MKAVAAAVVVGILAVLVADRGWPASHPSRVRWAVVPGVVVASSAAGELLAATTVQSAALLVLAGLGGALALVDVRHHRLPDPLTFALLVVTAGLGALASGVEGTASPLVLAAAGAAVAFLVLVVLVVAGSGLGGGDVKFAAGIGGLVGLLGGPVAAVVSLALGFIAVAVCAAIGKVAHGETHVAYGPGLWVGAVGSALLTLV